ncbi:hypothetical protein BKA62DRAFT_720357 [Auriculariales sp. MPI-PUGE-AT-0066]|nr:hypothetical protein BKA62DRAFT_720357 [Auriculariales sp. MPI-PUGE-AT-0066]
MAFCVAEKLEEKDVDLSATLTIDTVRHLPTYQPEIDRLLGTFLPQMAQEGATIDHIALLALQSLVFSVIFHGILAPFVPNCAAAHHPALTALTDILDLISKQESQEKSGRWRIMTYKALRTTRNDKAFALQISTELFFALRQLLSATLTSPVGDTEAFYQDIFEGLADRANKLINTAIQIQDLAKQVYISCDYSIYYPNPNDMFSPDTMEIVDPGPEVSGRLKTALRRSQTRGRVLLPLAPGLRAFRGGAQLSGSTTVVKKAKVIAIL